MKHEKIRNFYWYWKRSGDGFKFMLSTGVTWTFRDKYYLYLFPWF